MRPATLLRVARDRGLLAVPRIGANLVLYRWYRDVLRQRYHERRVHDYRMLLDFQDKGLSRDLWLFGTRELEHIHMLREVLGEGMAVLDLGANIGYYTIMMARLVGPRGRVYAVEPAPWSYSLLNLNVVLNGLDDVVETSRLGISNRVGTDKLYVGEHANQNSFYPYSHTGVAITVSPHSPAVEVPVTTIPEFVRGKRPIDLVRMDIEGFEVEVFEGMLPGLADAEFRPRFLFETHQHAYQPETHDMRAVLARLFERGYRAAMVASDGHERGGAELFAGRGYRPSTVIVTDSTRRGLYRDVADADALHFVCDTPHVRTVLLERRRARGPV